MGELPGRPWGLRELNDEYVVFDLPSDSQTYCPTGKSVGETLNYGRAMNPLNDDYNTYVGDDSWPDLQDITSGIEN